MVSSTQIIKYIIQVTTHQEKTEYSMLSMIANLTPFSDFNQSPRNMYQCQVRVAVLLCLYTVVSESINSKRPGDYIEKEYHDINCRWTKFD